MSNDCAAIHCVRQTVTVNFGWRGRLLALLRGTVTVAIHQHLHADGGRLELKSASFDAEFDPPCRTAVIQ